MTHAPYLRGCIAALILALSIVPATSASAEYPVVLTQQSPRSISKVRFHFVADGPFRGGFGLAGGRLLFGTETGSFYALDASNGRVLWTSAVGSPVLSTPAIAGGSALFTTWDNVLHALDVGTGRELWRSDLGRTIGPNDYWEYYVSSPIVADGKVYVGSGSGRLFALDASSGQVIWSYDAGARIRTTPTIDGDAVIVGTMAGHVIAVDRSSGRKRWDFATVGASHDFAFKKNDTTAVVTQPIVAGGVVIAGGRDGNIYGIDRQTGAGRWQETHDGGSWILGLAADRARFYSGSGSAYIMQAADPATGKEVWRTPTGNAMFGGVALAGGVLVSNGIQGNLFGFDADTGAQLWNFHLADLSFSSPLVADGLVYTGADDGSVYALDTSTAAPVPLDRYVYSFTDEPPESTIWFKPEMLENIRQGFLAAGYSRLGTADLAAALATPTTDKGRRVIVLDDARLPDGMEGDQLRAFLDGGGILVMLGVDPLVYSFDAKGQADKVDEQKETAAFGIGPADKERDSGYNVSNFTPQANELGLFGRFTDPQWTTPATISTVLAADRAGMATAWTKRFANGGMLIELPLPRIHSVDLASYLNAIDLAAAGSAHN